MLPAGAYGLPSLPTTLTRAAIGWPSSTRTVNFFESAARANAAQATTQVMEQTAKALFNAHLLSCASAQIPAYHDHPFWMFPFSPPSSNSSLTTMRWRYFMLL